MSSDHHARGLARPASASDRGPCGTRGPHEQPAPQPDVPGAAGAAGATWWSGVSARLHTAAETVTTRTVHTVPAVIVSAVVDHVPACDAAAILFLDRVATPGERPLPDAATGPVMIGVLAADAMTRGGPLHGALRRRDRRRVVAPVWTGDLRTTPRWRSFNDRLVRTGSPVRTLLVVPVDGESPAVLVLASFEPAALSTHAVAVRGLTDAVRSLLRTVAELPAGAPVGRTPR